MTEPTTVPGQLALYAPCPYCGTLQTERLVTDDFVKAGGTLGFRCTKCVATFRVNWIGLTFDAGTETLY